MTTLAKNKKAYYNYEIKEKLEAGISLLGQEVKSIKGCRINLAGSYVVLRNEEVYLVGANIPPYQPKNAPVDYNPERPRKLLLRKSEIKHLIGKVKERGLTLVPLKVYTKRGRIKLEFGIGKGKKKADKRKAIKKREFEREKTRLLRT
ncbi:MAG: SsrA-binding protein SmpB [Candidatus Nealsonbacteria bacterium]|nr:SsrA-binding protein SmpB [Candidatus Nealsonbacteria bacterium]